MHKYQSKMRCVELARQKKTQHTMENMQKIQKLMKKHAKVDICNGEITQ